jgi:ribosomal protein S18 acetylase RimI-like enzyme
MTGSDAHEGPSILTIRPGTARYDQAAEVRYAALYEPLGLGREFIADTDGRIYEHYAAVRDGAVVGYARLLLDDLGEGVIGPEEAKVFQVAVETTVRGTGVGSALVAAIVTRAAAAGRRRLVLDARVESVGFYEQLGFRTEGVRFQSPRTSTPHVRMLLDLP